MQKEEIFQVLNSNLSFFLATVEENEARVRAMMLYKADNSGIVFHTSPAKDVYKQIVGNPNVQMCFYDQTKNIQIRVRGKLELVDDDNFKAEISSHPSRAFMQNWKANCATEQEFFNMFSIFRLKNGKANVWTFETNNAPKEDIAL